MYKSDLGGPYLEKREAHLQNNQPGNLSNNPNILSSFQSMSDLICGQSTSSLSTSAGLLCIEYPAPNPTTKSQCAGLVLRVVKMFVGDKPKMWPKWLHVAIYCLYNSINRDHEDHANIPGQQLSCHLGGCGSRDSCEPGIDSLPPWLPQPVHGIPFCAAIFKYRITHATFIPLGTYRPDRCLERGDISGYSASTLPFSSCLLRQIPASSVCATTFSRMI